MHENSGKPAIPFEREKTISRKSGIAKSGFDHKELGKFAINPSLNRAVKCLYCSTEGVFCRSKSYRENVGDWWQCDRFVSYSNIVDAVADDLGRLAHTDAEVVMSSVVDS